MCSALISAVTFFTAQTEQSAFFGNVQFVAVVIVFVVVVPCGRDVHAIDDDFTNKSWPIVYVSKPALPVTATMASPFCLSSLTTQALRPELFTTTRSRNFTVNLQDGLGRTFTIVDHGQESPQPPTVKKVPYHSAQVRGAGLLQVLRQSGAFTVVDASKVVMQMFRHYEGSNMCSALTCAFTFFNAQTEQSALFGNVQFVAVVIVFVVVVPCGRDVHAIDDDFTNKSWPIVYVSKPALPVTATMASPFCLSSLTTQALRPELFTTTRSRNFTVNLQDGLGRTFTIVDHGQESPQPPTVKKVPYHSAQVRGAGLLQVLRQSGAFTVVDASKVVMQMFRHYEGSDVFCANMCIWP